jgi:hypothetical protein
MNVEQLKKKVRKIITHYVCEDSYYSCPQAYRGQLLACTCGYEKKIKKLERLIDSVYNLDR